MWLQKCNFASFSNTLVRELAEEDVDIACTTTANQHGPWSWLSQTIGCVDAMLRANPLQNNEFTLNMVAAWSPRHITCYMVISHGRLDSFFNAHVTHPCETTI